MACGTFVFGVALGLLLIVYIVLNGRYGAGYAQRGMAVAIGVGMLILAYRLRALGRMTEPGA